MPFFPRSSSKRSTRRRRRGDGDDARPLAFDVEALEFVPAGDDVGLLRLSGHWSAPLERVVPAPIELEIERDGESVRIEPLPDPTAGPALAGPSGELWRAAFMAPVELAEDPRSDFALAAAGEVVAGLPRPGDAIASPELTLVGDEAVEEEDAGDEPRLYAVEDLADPIEALIDDEDAEAEAPSSAVEAGFADLVAEHVSARVAAEERAAAAVDELSRVDAGLTEARAELAHARAELDETRAELERTRAGFADVQILLDQARAELEDGTRDAGTARSELAAARDELDKAHADAEYAHAELDRARADAEAARADAEASSREVESVRADLEATRTELEPMRAEADAARAEAEVMRGELQAARAELDAARSDADAARSEAQVARAEAEVAAAGDDDRVEALHAELGRAREESETARAELDTARVEADAARADVESARAETETARSELEAERRRSDAVEAQLADAIAHHEELEAHAGEPADDGKVALLETELTTARTELNRERGLREAAEEKLAAATGDAEAESLRTKLAAVSEQLEQVRAELEEEYRRRSEAENELRAHEGMERQLRDSLAIREAELAAADSQAARRARASERRREPAASGDSDPAAGNVGNDFFERIERAKRLAETN